MPKLKSKCGKRRKKRGAKRDTFFERTMGEIEKHKAEHRRERIARGLSEMAGTGKPEPEILIRALPKRPYLNVPDPVKTREQQTMSRLRTGASRLGGLPDLPRGTPWPTFRGKKLPFVAQFDLSKFPKSRHRIFPKEGHVFAFALISNDKRHWPSPTSVFVFSGPTSKLKRAKAPARNEIWPDWCGNSVYEVLPATVKTVEQVGKTSADDTDPRTLGWLFGEICPIWGTTAGKLADEQFGDGDDWINFIALYSGGSMLWSDAGDLYLMIRRSALEKLDFSNVIGQTCSS